MSECWIEGDGIESICESLSGENTSLVYLNLKVNKPPSSREKQLKRVEDVSKNKSLIAFDEGVRMFIEIGFEKR